MQIDRAPFRSRCRRIHRHRRRPPRHARGARAEIDPFNLSSPAIFVDRRSCTPSRRRGSRDWRTPCSAVTTRGDRAASAAGRASRRSCCTSSARSRSCSGCGPSCWSSAIACGSRLGDRDALRQRHSSTTPSRCSWSSSWRWRRRGRSSRSPKRRCTASRGSAERRPAAWWLAILTIAPLLGSFITEPAAMTIAALLLGRQFYDLNPGPRAQVRDPRTAVRQRLDRRHADAFRGAAGADGGAALGLGHGLHADAHRLARGRRDRRRRTLAYFADLPPRAASAGARCRRQPDIDRGEENIDGAASPAAVAGAGLGHVGARAVHRLDGLHLALSGAVSRRVPLLPRLRARHRRRIRVADRPARRRCSSASSSAAWSSTAACQSWWIAPVLSSLSEHRLYFAATILTAFNDNALITYLATLVPNLDDRLKMRGGRRRGDRRRSDGDRQRAQSRRTGAPQPVLRRRHPAVVAAGRRAPADADRGRSRSGCSESRAAWNVPSRATETAVRRNGDERATCWTSDASLRRESAGC